HGMFGGCPGAPSVMVLMENTAVAKLTASNKPATNIAALGGRKKILPYCNFELHENDVLYMRVASGGGYGGPRARDPALVQEDVANAIVCLDAARKLYGVVIEEPGFRVDFEATRRLRIKMRRKGTEGSDESSRP